MGFKAHNNWGYKGYALSGRCAYHADGAKRVGVCVRCIEAGDARKKQESAERKRAEAKLKKIFPVIFGGRS